MNVKPKLVALVGHAGVGKDTVASYMPARRFSFAEPLKRFCQEVFAFTDEQVFGSSEHRNRPDLRYPRACDYGQCHGPGDESCPACKGQPVYLTPRYALQTLGTEWGRNCFPDVWAVCGVRRALEYLRGPVDEPIAVITDCRFVNEAKAVRDAGGEVWRIVRRNHFLPPEILNHPSEQEQDTPEMEALISRTIVNRGTLDELRAHVDFTVAQFLQPIP